MGERVDEAAGEEFARQAMSSAVKARLDPGRFRSPQETR